MDEVKVMDDQKRDMSLNRPVKHDTTQFIVTQLGGEQYGIDIKYISKYYQNVKDNKSTKGTRLYQGCDQCTRCCHSDDQPQAEDGAAGG